VPTSRPLEVSGLCSPRDAARLPRFRRSPASCSEGEGLEKEGEGLDWWRTSRSTFRAGGVSLPAACRCLKREKVVLLILYNI